MQNEWMNPFPIILFYVIHAIVVLLIYGLISRRMKEENKATWQWITAVSLFLPVIGELFGLVVWFVAGKWGTNDMLDDYDQYVNYKPLMLEQLRTEAKMSDELLPFTEAFSDEGNKQRKDLILRLINSRIVDKGKYLNLGLNNNDSETVHYAATTMNHLIDNYEKELHLRKQEHETGNASTLEPLLLTYDSYLNSGLLQEAAYKRLEQSYIDLMEEEVSNGVEAKVLFHMLGEAYLSRSQKEQGMATLTMLIEHFPSEPEGYLSKIRFYYQEKDWKAIQSTLAELRESVPKERIPHNQQFVLDQMWGTAQ